MATNISHSTEETIQLGERWGLEARPGWIFGFIGDLGAGKTQLIRGIARGLGFKGRVHSPTFALIHFYEGGRIPAVHLDLYRLGGPEEIHSAELSDYLESPRGVSLVEWFDRWLPDAMVPTLSPGMFLRRVVVKHISENSREIIHEDFGS